MRSLRALLTLTLLALLTACANAPTVLPTNAAPPAGATTPPPPAITILDTTPTPRPVDSTAPTAEPGGDASAPAVFGPESYPAGINPLTGLAVSDPSLLTRRPLAIKISNFPRYVRPQSGLSFADIVWEHYAEGGTTRFTAIFLGNIPPLAGPLRSARLIDTVIPEMLDAMLVTSGGSTGTMGRLARKPWYLLIISDLTGFNRCPPLCRESDDTNALFTNPLDIWAEEQAITGITPPDPIRGLAFSEAVPTGGTPVTTLRIDYSGEANSEWRYDPTTRRYQRYSDVSAGVVEPLFDAVNNAPITASNIVVLFANHVVDPTIPEDYDAGGLSGYFATEVQIWGTGQGLVFRDGQMFEVTWARLDDGMVRLIDANGFSLPFRPGTTWFQPVGLTSEITATPPTYFIRHRSPLDRGNLIGVEDFLTQTAEAPPPTETPEGGEALDATPTPSP